jgi:hypothetical protein
MSNTTFREGHLYALPNGLEFLLSEGEDESYLLRSPEGTVVDFLSDYRLSSDGRIYYGHTRTNWGSADLTDTGKTSKG